MILKIKMNYFNFFTKKMLELCSRYLFIPNWHGTPNPQFNEGSGPLRGPDGSSDGGFRLPCQFGMNKYLEHLPVKAPFWDI